MKIVEAISDTNIGGAGILLINRLRHTDRRKYDITVLVPKGSKLVTRLTEIGIDFVEVNGCKDRSFDIGAMVEYIKLIKKIKPSIINSHGCLSARVAAYICGVPIRICTRHCVFPVTKKHGAVRRMKGVLNSALSHVFIAVAHAAKENLEELCVDSKKIKVIINGSEPLQIYGEDEREALRRKLGIDDSTYVLCMCARLEPCKGHKYLLKTLKLLCDQGVDCIAILMGDGSIKNKLEQMCIDLGIQGRVIFTGFVDNVAPYMNIAHINVNCSIGTETSSLALSEGMSIGIPAVVSDFGGNPYMVKHGVNGFVYPQKDYKILAEYIRRLINDKALYDRMSAQCKQRFSKELNAAAMADKTNSLYDALYLRKR